MGVYIPYTRLPSEYQKVEYIESSGTQYIDTGVSANQYLSFEIDFQILSYVANAHQFGARTGAISERFGLTLYDNTFHMIVGNASTWNIAFDTNRHTGSVFLDNGTFTGSFDGEIINTGSVGTSVYVNQNYRLFKVNYSTYSSGSDPMRIYSFKLYTGSSNLVRDFIPCYRKSDGVIGMYDLVNDQFYTNSGTGTFTKGNDITMSELKNAYIGEVWIPGANTIAYFPFIDDKSNAISGSNISVSNSNIGITTLGGVKCLQLDGTSTQTLSTGYSKSDVTSFMCWVYGVNGHLLSERKTGSGFDQARNVILSDTNITYNRYQSALADISYNTTLNDRWHCIGYTEDSSGAKIFLDGNQAAVATNGTTRTFVNLTDNVGFGCYSDNGALSSASTGYISRLVLLNDSITVSDFLDFYNQTKSDYGL